MSTAEGDVKPTPDSHPIPRLSFASDSMRCVCETSRKWWVEGNVFCSLAPPFTLLLPHGSKYDYPPASVPQLEASYPI